MITLLADKYFLDALLGFVPSVGDLVSSVFGLPFIYVTLFKVKSIPLTLAVIYNYLVDILLGSIPFFIGDAIDFFCKAHVKNLDLMRSNMEKDINILAIETSCDETAAAVVKNGRDVLSNVISSQIELHTLYGGVVPEIASRKHIENINYVIEKALLDAKMSLEEVDALAVTYGPGLVGALLVGVAEAKAISYALKKPLIPVHHIEGHVCANYIENKDLKCPFICLIVSGGHTNLVAVKDYTSFQIIGKTRDDAAGEAFDKVARSIGLGYPGGPKIEKKDDNAKLFRFTPSSLNISVPLAA